MAFVQKSLSITIFAVSLCSAQVTLSGRFHGLEGTDLDSATVTLKEGVGSQVYCRASVRADGSFSLRTQHSGSLLAEFSAPHHRPLQVALLSEPKTSAVANVALGRDAYAHETGTLALSHPSSLMSKFAMLHLRFTQCFERFSSGVVNLGAEAYHVQEALRSETDALLRQELIMQYIELYWNGSPLTSADSIKRWIVEIPPASPAWVYHTNLAQMSSVAYRTDPYEYVNEVIAHHPSNAFARFVYDNALIMVGMKEGRSTGTVWSDDVRPLVPVCHVGDRVPQFDLQSLDRPQERLSPESMKGKVYLIEFWATWCGQSLAQMPYLHSAYERYKDHGFTIISVAEDDSAAPVWLLRERAWTMPWENALVNTQAAGSIQWLFGARTTPWPVLVSSGGTILALGDDLKGDKLQGTLAKFIDGVGSTEMTN